MKSRLEIREIVQRTKQLKSLRLESLHLSADIHLVLGDTLVRHDKDIFLYEISNKQFDGNIRLSSSHAKNSVV